MASIVGGDVAAPGAWPDVVAVEYPWGVGCTGTLVAPDLVLTAAHCIPAVDAAIVGAHDYEVDGERIEVIDAWGHDDPVHTYDVGLLRLASPASAAPRPLVRDCTVDLAVDGAPVTLVGYGAIDLSGREYETLQREAHTALVDADCSDLSRGCNEDVSPGGELVAGGEGVDSCSGDSGGPLFLDLPDGHALLGVTSRGSEPSEHVCGDGGIYVRADAIAAWIEETSGETLPRPACDGWNAPPAPSADAIVVYAGDTATAAIAANDPDAAQHHTYALASVPFGAVTIDATGLVTYVAPVDYAGADDFVVTVTDDGAPPRSADVTVQVDVHPQPIARGGCATTPGNPLAAALLAGWLTRAARPRSSGRTGSRGRSTR